MSNIFKVITGRLTWVGYAGVDDPGLPSLKKGVLPVIDEGNNELVCHNANVAYAKDYEWWMDLKRLQQL